MRDVLFRSKSIPKSMIWVALVPAFYFLGLWMEGHPVWFERLYAGTVQKIMMQFISQGTGYIPFSIAEVLVVSHLAAIPVSILVLIYKSFKGGAGRFLYQVAVYAAFVYVVFMAVWGLNYSRQPLSDLMGFEIRPYALEELHGLAEALIDQANDLRTVQKEDENGLMRISSVRSELMKRTHLGYDALGERFDLFSGTWGTPKTVILSEAMLYTGITGIFMPFTGEANVNGAIPDLLLPAVAMHEKAHQMGIAREDEANYAAYLACIHHPDPDFKYSGTVLALIHTMNALHRDAPEQVSLLGESYSEELRRDLQAYSDFWKRYEGKVNDTADRVNDTYLKTNRQQDGVKSYGRMVDLLLADFLSGGT